MTLREKMDSLINYRLKQADEAMSDAIFLFDNNRGTQSVVNRIYYAMFYSVLALLVKEPFQSSKHSGVIGYFNRRFIKEKIFPSEMGTYINIAYEARHEGDYKEFSQITEENVQELLTNGKKFIIKIAEYIKENVGKPN